MNTIQKIEFFGYRRHVMADEWEYRHPDYTIVGKLDGSYKTKIKSGKTRETATQALTIFYKEK